jgi:4-amino-4-deoxy-L-arabinose transferase-like glycosyltransferase
MNRKKIVIILFLLVIVYFVSRFVNLTALPIFTDEAIYIRWAQIAKQDASWRFISLTDGKQPLFVWGAMVTLRFLSDPLEAGRLVSVISGFFSMIGIGLLAREIFKSTKTGLFASFLYIIYPFALVYDRMALMDTMTAMFSIWSLYFAILLVRTLRLDVALILGMILGGGVLTKTSGFISIYLLPTTLLLFNWKREKRYQRLLEWVGFAALAVIMSQLYYSILRLSPWFHMIAQKDITFIYPIKEWLEHPLRFLYGNLKGEFDWLWRYLTIPLFSLLVLSVLIVWKKFREKVLLIIWFITPFIGLALFGKVLYPRFILFMTMPLLVLAAWALNYLSNKITSKLLLFTLYFLLFAYPLYFDTKILFSVLTAPIPKSDKNQYVHDWPSGWGIRETVDILEKKAKDKKITVYTEGNFGLLPYGIEIYLVDNPNIEIIGLWPPPREYTEEMKIKIKNKPTYYVSNQFEKLEDNWSGKLVGKWHKGNNANRYLRLYRLKLPEIN